MLGDVDKTAVRKWKGKYKIDSAMHFLPTEWRCSANDGEYFIYIRFFGKKEIATQLVGERFGVHDVSMIGVYDAETEYEAGTMLPIVILSYDTDEEPHVKEVFDYMEWEYDEENIGSTFK